MTTAAERSARLRDLFAAVDPLEVTELVDLAGRTAAEIAQLLPRFTTVQQEGTNPAFGLLVDPRSGRAWSLRSGFDPTSVETFNGIPYRSGTMTRETAHGAGGPWAQERVPLGAHVEGQAAAFMRKAGLLEAVLYINGSTPCRNGGIGCFYRLPELLPEGATLLVYNKNGLAFPPFEGITD